MAMNHIRSLRSTIITKETVGVVGGRTFSAGGGKAKKGPKGGAPADTPKASILSKEVKSKIVGANILKDGTDPKILPDSEYPDCRMWHLLDKHPALSELRRKNIENLPYEDLKRFFKLNNRARIKENNSTTARN